MVNTELLIAYENTTFRVFTPPISIKIHRISNELDLLLSDHGKKEWAFITAYNPYSKVVSDEENHKRQKELLEMVKQYPTYEGQGEGEDPAWQPELSLLIIGISRQDASDIGNHFEQNAIVAGNLNEPAELIVLR